MYMPKDKPEFIVRVNPKLCKSCGLCVDFCGRGALKMSDETKSGKHVPEVDIERCTGCRLCEWYCPDFAIWIERKVEKKAAVVTA
jgi:NAD-dependent dihydropyrimidine dehydrogenase PreA subunit